MRAKHEDEDVVLRPSRKFHVRALTSEQAAERFASRALPEPVTFCFGSHSLFIASASALSASYVEKQFRRTNSITSLPIGNDEFMLAMRDGVLKEEQSHHVAKKHRSGKCYLRLLQA